MSEYRNKEFLKSAVIQTSIKREIDEVYTKAEAFDALQEGLNKLIDEYDKKARAEFEHGFIGPATEAIDIKNKIKNIVNHESEAE